MMAMSDLVVEGAAAAQMEQVDALALQSFAIRRDNRPDRHVERHGDVLQPFDDDRHLVVFVARALRVNGDLLQVIDEQHDVAAGRIAQARGHLLDRAQSRHRRAGLDQNHPVGVAQQTRRGSARSWDCRAKSLAATPRRRRAP